LARALTDFKVSPGLARAGAALAAAVLALSACSRDQGSNQQPEPGDRPAARVAGETIWVSDVRRQAVAQGAIGEGEPLDVSSDLFARTVNEVIDQKLLAREAVRLKLDREPAARRRLLAARERVLGDMLIEGVVDRAVNENAIRALYQEQQRLSQTSEELRARQIVLPSQVDAEAVRKLLDTGASFEALALQRSTDQATRFNGGDLGYFTLDAMPEAYQAALAQAQPSQVVGPFATDAGWALVKVEDRRPEQPITLEEARPQIMRFLTYDEIRTLLTRLRGQTQVETLLGRPAEGPGAPREPASAPPAGSVPAAPAAPAAGSNSTAPAQPAAPSPPPAPTRS
jgi:peptidyl-prolyl cis-trans isomerase C